MEGQCEVNNFTIIGDDNNRLYNLITDYCQYDTVKAITIASFINNNNSDFANYLSKTINRQIDNVAEVLLEKDDDSIISIIKEYYNTKHKSIKDAENISLIDDLENFLSIEAKHLAYEHTANVIKDTYVEKLLSTGKKPNKKDLFNEVSNKITREWLDRIDKYISTLDAKDPKVQNIKELEKECIELRNKALDANSPVEERNAARQEFISKRNNVIDAKIELAYENTDNIQLYNYTNLFEAIFSRADAFYKNVLKRKELTDLVRSYNNDYIDNYDINQSLEDDTDFSVPESESVDESSKSWSDKEKSSFLEGLSSDVKLYLDSLYHASSVPLQGSDVMTYDTNNELGIPRKMGYSFIVSQLLGNCSFTSVDNFLKEIEALSGSSELHGLYKICIDGRNNREFINKLFQEVAKVPINKIIINVKGGEIEVTHSNKSIDKKTSIIEQIATNIRNLSSSLLFSEDLDKLSAISTSINKYKKLAGEEVEEAIDKEIEKAIPTITKILKRIVPDITTTSIENFINNYKGEKQAVNRIENLNILLQNIKNINDNIDSYKATIAKNIRKANSETGTKEEELARVSALEENKSKLFQHIIPLANNLLPYVSIKQEFNSINAEGNLTSDTTDNNFITNIMKLINYGTEEDAFRGLNILKDEISKSQQYQFNPFFWGIDYKENGETKHRNGLFIRTDKGVEINKDARSMIQAYLFNGVRDEETKDAVMYDTSTKIDFLYTALELFNNPIKTGTAIEKSNKELKDNSAIYFPRTPSDAPKTFPFHAPKYKLGNIFINSEEVEKYKDEFHSYIIGEDANGFSKDKYTSNLGSYKEITIINPKETLENKDTTKNNFSKIRKFAKTLFTKINTDGYQQTIGSYRINTVRQINGKTQDAVIVIKTRDYYKDTDENNKPKVEKREVLNYTIVSKDENGTIIPAERSEAVFNTNSPNEYTEAQNILYNFFEEEFKYNYIKENNIVKLNQIGETKGTQIHEALKSYILDELSLFISQLNNIVTYKNGVYKLKTKTNGLFKYAHYNSKRKEEDKDLNPFIESVVVGNKKQYRLNGNLFKIQRLKELDNYKINEKLISGLFLYGGTNESLLQIDKNGNITINTNHILVSVNDKGKLSLDTKKVEQGIVPNVLDTIINEWIKEYYNETADDYSKLSDNVKEKNTLNNYFDFKINYGTFLMTTETLFEGDSKFYKNEQTLLKRAKEVPAGGKLNGAFNIERDRTSESIDKDEDIVIADGITLDDFVKAYSKLPVEEREKSFKARSGFRAITISDVSKIKTNLVTRIEKELQTKLEKKLGKDNTQAIRIARKIAKGYSNTIDANDAQSYITLEEFIRRKYYDGTLSQYSDILKQIYEARKNGTELELNLDEINARIQVQKNFYFDKKYDKKLDIHYPRQIKNAEYVLIPELLEGTELKGLYDFMVKHGIDQVNSESTSKAATKNVITYWKENGELNDKVEKEYTKEANEVYFYDFLYKQQDTQSHLVDEENKAGVQILKKINDNASPELKESINKLFTNFCANIKGDFENFIYKMGWKLDKNGKLVNIDNPDKKLNFEEFCKSARVEAQRLGLDDNFLDYLKTDEQGNFIYPNYINIVATKLESIAQSMFNKNITRQTLPGWHAVQVSPVGHETKVLDDKGKLRQLKYHPAVYINNKTKEKIQEEDYNKLSEEEKANYSVKQEAYAECMIPRWSKLIPKGYDISKLEKEGLDLQIAYRIPTEGKQSISIVKVVGFLDDVYDSTIILPEEWVLQTGADYDIDTVYGITYNMYSYKDKNGNTVIKKYTRESYKNKEDLLYRKYIEDKLLVKLDLVEDKKDETNKYVSIKKELLEIINAYGNKDNKISLDTYIKRLNDIAKKLSILSYEDFSSLPVEERMPREVRENEILDAFIEVMSSDNSTEENYARSNYDSIKEAKEDKEKLCGITSKRRSNYEVSDQIDFQENATSGMALKAMSVSRDSMGSICNKAKTKIQNNYVQIEYDLKLYNIEDIESAYEKSNLRYVDDKGNIYSDKIDNAVKIIVRHDRICNSRNNRNVVGELITSYSSQTTAHILDVIKEGSLFNENIYTFGTFKTLVELGTDYHTAIAFLYQPAITLINEINDKSNSIYIKEKSKPIETAIKTLLKKIPNVKIEGDFEYLTLQEIEKQLGEEKNTEFVNQLKALGIYNVYDTKGQFKFNSLALSLNRETLEERLQSEDNPLFDLAIVCTFNNIMNITNIIEDNMRCINPDKFGAKQTIHETRAIINKIKTILTDENAATKTRLVCPAKVTDPITKQITYQDIDFLKGIYFNTSNIFSESDINIDNIDIENSVYPYLASFLKYSTMFSIETNKELFAMENDYADSVLQLLENKLGRKLNQKQYKEYKQYTIAELFDSIPILVTPFTVDKDCKFIQDDKIIEEYDKQQVKYWNKEVLRIHGYEETISTDFDILDINNPTEEELDSFKRLTPAQKVLWCKMNLEDSDNSIFSYLTINRFNQYIFKNKGYVEQKINIADSIENFDNISRLFTEVFNKKSPILRLTMLDLIKYAFVVEGYKFRKSSISKYVPNNALYNNLDNYGTDIIESIKNTFTSNFVENKDDETRFDKFIRSHSSYCRTAYLGNRIKSGKLNILHKVLADSDYQITTADGIKSTGMYAIKYDETSKDIGNVRALLDKLGIDIDKLESGKTDLIRYVNIDKIANKQHITKLYKIVYDIKENEGVTDTTIYLIPLNKLEENEHLDNSVNNKNNTNYLQSTYETIIYNIDKFKSTDKADRFTQTFSINNDPDFIENLGEQKEYSKFVEELKEELQNAIDNKKTKIQLTITNNIFKDLGIKSTQNIILKHPATKKEVIAEVTFIKIAKTNNKYKAIITLPETKSVKKSITKDITDIEIEVNTKENVEVDDAIETLVKALIRDSKRDKFKTIEIIDKLYRKGISPDNRKSIEDNRIFILNNSAMYIDRAASLLMNSINNYKLGDKTYNLGQKEFYQELLNYPEEVDNVMSILLDSITFGGTLGDILSLPLDSVEEDLKKTIEDIRKNINIIRNNPRIKEGFKNMFNIYIANKYATNPNIRSGLTELRDTFGDANWWETWIGSPSVVGNKEMQVIFSHVMNIIRQAQMIDAPRAKVQFLNSAKAILDESGSYSIDNIIDSKGRLLLPYKDEFLTKRDKLKHNLDVARIKYGIDSREYVYAKLERDKFLAINTHQEIQKDYYLDIVNATEEILKIAENEYIEYKRLQHELFNDQRPFGHLTEAEKERRITINQNIRNLLRVDKKIKTKEQNKRAAALKKYIKRTAEIRNKYLEWRSNEEFDKKLKESLDIMSEYDIKHPTFTLSQKLENERYAEAYDWVSRNTYYTIDEEINDKIIKAFDTLRDENNTTNSEIQLIIDLDKAYDEYGNIDPRKLSKESIDKIRKIALGDKIEDLLLNVDDVEELLNDDAAGINIDERKVNTNSLIKDIKPGIKPYIKPELFDIINGGKTKENTKEQIIKAKIIGNINKILTKVLQNSKGGITPYNLLNTLSREEIITLGNLYKNLAITKSGKSKEEIEEYINRLNENVTFEIDDTNYVEYINFKVNDNLEDSDVNTAFAHIFCKTNYKGKLEINDKGTYSPNPNLYGYMLPKDETYIDKDKEEAIRLIEENIEFETTEYYKEAAKEAKANGTFNEWFKQNHIYNKYKNRFEPLRIWTTIRVKPNNPLGAKYEYIPTYENKDYTVKEKFKNPSYKKKGINYDTSTGEFNSTHTLTPKEEKMANLLQEAMNYFMEHNPNSSFLEQGYVPRKYKQDANYKYVMRQALGSLGLEWRNDAEDRVDEKGVYETDKFIPNEMLQFLKGKGYRELKQIRPKLLTESEKEYQEYVLSVKQENEEIRKKNIEIDNAYLNRDFITIFAEAIEQQEVINARNRAKNWLYLLQEELKQNPAYKISKVTGKPIRTKKEGVLSNNDLVTTEQENALKIVQDFTRRAIFSQFRNSDKMNKYADIAKNITSAKYMIFNVTGGIANIGTGFANIMGEFFAEDSFDKETLRKAVGMYIGNSISMVTDMYKDHSDNFAVALTKFFKIVDIDAMNERQSGETIGEYSRRIRNLLYSMQSGGEHFMQNSVLFAVLKSSRIYKDIDGETRVGTFENYTWKTEYNAFLNTIKDDSNLLLEFTEFKHSIKNNKREVYSYDTFKKNIIEEFLRKKNDKELNNKYFKNRKEALKNAKEEWNKLDIVIDQLTQDENGDIIIKNGSELTNEMLTKISNTTIELNRKIHGYYDKLSAARIEFSWWGGLVMQYHKHIYPGMMKRYRRKGYYNEQLETIETGSYNALINWWTTEFNGIKDRIKDRQEAGELQAVASIKEVAEALVNNILHIKTNWNLMPQYERNACKRALGDLYGIISAMLMGIAIYAMTDDDDEKENEMVATALYLSDRLLAESQMYTFWGLATETKTLWSSPIAATNSIQDAIKALGFITQWIFDDDYNPNYKTGLYAGQNKLEVLIKRNIPMWRVYNRLSNMTKNNKFYRLSENAINMKVSKGIADSINPN